MARAARGAGLGAGGSGAFGRALAQRPAPAAPQGGGGRLPLRVTALRVAGTEIPNNKKVPYALQYVYGIGDPTAWKIVEKVRGRRRDAPLPPCRALPPPGPPPPNWPPFSPPRRPGAGGVARAAQGAGRRRGVRAGGGACERVPSGRYREMPCCAAPRWVGPRAHARLDGTALS